MQRHEVDGSDSDADAETVLLGSGEHLIRVSGKWVRAVVSEERGGPVKRPDVPGPEYVQRRR